MLEYKTVGTVFADALMHIWPLVRVLVLYPNFAGRLSILLASATLASRGAGRIFKRAWIMENGDPSLEGIRMSACTTRS